MFYITIVSLTHQFTTAWLQNNVVYWWVACQPITHRSHANELAEATECICAPGSTFNYIQGNQINNYMIIIHKIVVQWTETSSNFLVTMGACVVITM